MIKDNLEKKYFNEKDYDNLLLRACEINDMEMATVALNNNANVNFKNNFRQTPIMFALLNANVNLVETLKNKNADLLAVDSNSNTLYHYVLGMDFKLNKEKFNNIERTDCFKLIHTGNKDYINIANSLNVVPLHLCAHYGYNEVMEDLLKDGANVEVFDNNDNTPLVHCYIGNNGANDDLLFAYGADVNYNEWQKHSVLQRVLVSNIGDDKIRFANKLIEKGATIEAMQLEYMLDGKIASGVKELAQKLMKKQLVRSLEKRQDKVAKQFLSKGQVNALFEYLIAKNAYKDAKILIQMGMPLDIQEKKSGDTRLIKAIRDNDEKLAKFLVENGALINLRNNYGETGTELAIKNSSSELINFMFNNGGHIYVRQAQFNKYKEKLGAKNEEQLYKNAVILKTEKIINAIHKNYERTNVYKNTERTM